VGVSVEAGREIGGGVLVRGVSVMARRGGKVGRLVGDGAGVDVGGMIARRELM
jgi:hypothetical protein